jgi:hypothetical protein
MRQAATHAAKMLALWAALIGGAMLGNALFGPGMPIPAGDGPLTAGQAFLAVTGLTAVLLGALAARMTGPAWRRAALLFLLLFTLETLLSQIEALFFDQWLGLPEDLLPALAGADALKASAAAAAAACLWRVREPSGPVPAGLAWKLPAIVAAYILAYFGAGYLVAWQSEAVRAFYGGGVDIEGGRLLLVQAGRGAIWAGLALIAAWSLRGPALHRALLTGAAFAVFMAAPLLYPNGFMPWAVRSIHLVEIALSNFLFGLFAVMLLASGAAVERKNRQDRPAPAA